MELKICHLYPDVLNLYGDGGNIACMRRRLEWRGVGAELVSMPIGSRETLSGFDIVFIGGGQDFEQQVLLEDLHRGRAAEIRAAAEDGVVFLTICGGYQMMGNYYETHDGKRCDFIGLLDLYTVGAEKRMIGNYKFRCTPAAGGSVVVGFENHSGRTFLGPSLEPLGLRQQRRGRHRGRALEERVRHIQPWPHAAQEPGVLRSAPRLRARAQIRLLRALPARRRGRDRRARRNVRQAVVFSFEF